MCHGIKYTCKLCEEKFEVCLGMNWQANAVPSRLYRLLFCRFCTKLAVREVKKPIRGERKLLLSEISRGNRIAWKKSAESKIELNWCPRYRIAACEEQRVYYTKERVSVLSESVII